MESGVTDAALYPDSASLHPGLYDSSALIKVPGWRDDPGLYDSSALIKVPGWRDDPGYLPKK